jgi:hypothetical protein
MVTDLDDVLFKYVSQSNPKSNEDLKRFLRLYPLYREEIIEFTATWRALSILEWVKPPLDPVDERQLMQQAKLHLRTLQRHRTSTRCEHAKGHGRRRKRRHAAWAK